MADYIPFVNSQKDTAFAKDYYSDAAVVRVSLELLKAKSVPRSTTKLWVDAGIDGFVQSDPNPQWKAFADGFVGAAAFKRSLESPTKQTIDSLVHSALDACLANSPDWISVPQLPYSRDTSRNKTNRMLAGAAEGWRHKRGFRGIFILPIILSHQEQTTNRTHWKPRVELAKTCFERSGSDAYWVTDHDLFDQAGTGTFESKRFPGLIGFCEDLRKTIAEARPSVAGPFWGLNVLLWARGIVQYPAIGLGNAYRYNVAGGRQQQAAVRVALEPLRRWATLSPQLRSWLEQVTTKIPVTESSHHAFAELLTDFDRLHIDDRGRRQIAKFYKRWFDSLAAVPQHGRPLALYQDLSAAYVLGKSLPDLPKTEGSARRPEKIARQLMVNCL